MRRGIAAAATLLCALTMSACGGDSGDETLSPSAWANTLCTDLDHWKSSLESIRTSFGGGNLTPQNAQDAADQVGDSTETLVGELKDLGKPDTESGQEARDDVDELSGELEKGSNEIQRAADAVSSASDLPQATATIAATTRELGTELASTLTKLEQLDPQGELATALQQSPACKDLKTTGR